MAVSEKPKPKSVEWDKQLFYCAAHGYRVTGMDCDSLHVSSDECPPDCQLRARYLAICKGIEQMEEDVQEEAERPAEETKPEKTPEAMIPATLGDLRLGVRRHGQSESFYYDADGHPQMKICSRCKKPKGLDEYYRHKGFRHNITSHCIACDKSYHLSATQKVSTPKTSPKTKPPKPEVSRDQRAGDRAATKNTDTLSARIRKLANVPLEPVFADLDVSKDTPEQLLESIYTAAADRITRITVTFELG